MQKEFIYETEVRFENVDRNNQILLKSLFCLLQEVAIKHADLYDMGTKAIALRGESWVLNRMGVTIHRYPRYEDPLTVRTWSSGIKSFRGYREFRILSRGETLVSGSSLWLYISMAKRSIIRVPQALVDLFPSLPEQRHLPDLEKLELQEPDLGAPSFDLSLRYSDIDANEHVNNTTYFDCLQSALALAGRDPRPKEIVTQFIREIPAGVPSMQVRVDEKDGLVRFGIGDPANPSARGQVRY